MNKILRRNRISRLGFAKINEAALKFDQEGCDVCGHRPTGRKIYPIGRMGGRTVGVCHDHRRSLDLIIDIQIFIESEEIKKRREMTEAVSTDGQKH